MDIIKGELKKNMKKLLVSLSILLNLMFTSCDSDSNSDINTSNIGTSNNGDYWPTAINNVWEYNGAPKSKYKIVSTETIDGKQYFKFDLINVNSTNTMSTATLFIRKENGSYFYRIGQLNINANGINGVSQPFEFTILKDNIEVNESWTGNYMQTVTYDLNGSPFDISTSTNYKGTILAKNSTETVENITYKDVIKIKLQQVTTLQGQAQTIYSEHWFAKNVGLIKSVTDQNIQTLSSYKIN